jgi:hypothetical protein
VYIGDSETPLLAGRCVLDSLNIKLKDKEFRDGFKIDYIPRAISYDG